MILRRSVLSALLGSLGISILGTATAFACETSSWIATDPSSGAPGTKISITGAGFEPGTVIFRWDRSAESGGQVLGQATVGDDGDVVAEVTVPEATSGAHKVIAEHASSSETVAHADAWSDFYIPGAASGKGSEAESEETAGQAAERPASAAATEEPAKTEPVARPAEVASVQPVSEGTPVVNQSRAGEAADAGSRSQAPVPQLAWQLRAVDRATYPVLMDQVDQTAGASSNVPPRREAAAWDLRWIAAAVVAMIGGLLVLARGIRQSPEPEGAVVLVSPGHREEEETSRAA